jgi:hypothetical protein
MLQELRTTVWRPRMQKLYFVFWPDLFSLLKKVDMLSVGILCFIIYLCERSGRSRARDYYKFYGLSWLSVEQGLCEDWSGFMCSNDVCEEWSRLYKVICKRLLLEIIRMVLTMVSYKELSYCVVHDLCARWTRLCVDRFLRGKMIRIVL